MNMSTDLSTHDASTSIKKESFSSLSDSGNTLGFDVFAESLEPFDFYNLFYLLYGGDDILQVIEVAYLDLEGANGLVVLACPYVGARYVGVGGIYGVGHLRKEALLVPAYDLDVDGPRSLRLLVPGDLDHPVLVDMQEVRAAQIGRA